MRQANIFQKAKGWSYRGVSPTCSRGKRVVTTVGEKIDKTIRNIKNIVEQCRHWFNATGLKGLLSQSSFRIYVAGGVVSVAGGVVVVVVGGGVVVVGTTVEEDELAPGVGTHIVGAAMFGKMLTVGR